MAPNGYNQQTKCETVYKASDSVSSTTAAGYQPNVGTFRNFRYTDLQIMDVKCTPQGFTILKVVYSYTKYWPDSYAAEYIFVSDLFYTY